MFAHTALAANWLVLLALYLWLRSDELMPTTRRACLVWAGMGRCAQASTCTTCRWSVLCWWDTRCAAPCKTRPGGCAAACCGVLRRSAGRAGFARCVRCQLCGLLQRLPQRGGLPRPVCAVVRARLEQNVYMGVGAVWAVVLAIFSMVCNARKAEKFCRAPRLGGCGSFVLVLDLVAAGGNAITVGGETLFTVPIPQFLMNFWAMFSSCARLAWLAGMLLAVTACGLNAGSGKRAQCPP